MDSPGNDEVHGGSMRVLLICTLLLTGCATTTQPRSDLAALQLQVTDIERAFAKTMADRDFAAFQSFLAEETIWFGSKGAIRGKAAVSDKWKAFYEAPNAPFSWAPDTAEVLDSGKLALTSGPVYGTDGKLVSRFTSIWRLRDDGRWEVIFDKGCDACEACGKK
jgi:ketosteroid isomerase-like protein